MLRGNCATIVWAQLETPGCRALVRPQSLCVRWRWRGDGPERCPKSDCAKAGNCKTPPSIWMRYAQREGAIAAAFEIPSRNVGRSTWVCEGQWRGVRETGVADSELGSQQMPDGLSDCNLPKGERDLYPRILAAAVRAGESARGSGQAGAHTIAALEWQAVSAVAWRPGRRAARVSGCARVGRSGGGK